MKSYQNDLRERIVAAREAGQSAAEIAALFRVAARTVQRYWTRYQQEGHFHPKQRGGYRRSKLADHDATLRRWIEEKPDQTLAELQKRCVDELGITISLHGLWHRLECLGLSFKKNDARRRARPA